MIILHRLNKSAFTLNHRHIEIMESMPDTVITLINDRKYIVKESPDEIQALIEEHYRRIFKQNFENCVDI